MPWDGMPDAHLKAGLGEGAQGVLDARGGRGRLLAQEDVGPILRGRVGDDMGVGNGPALPVGIDGLIRQPAQPTPYAGIAFQAVKLGNPLENRLGGKFILGRYFV